MGNLSSDRKWDSAIIGGGLGGGLAAYHLARSGKTTVLFEKEKFAHHKVCGEFISGEGIPYLKEIGVDPFRLGGAPITRFRLHGPFRTLEARLPLAAVGVSRYVLDEEVLAAATRAGAEVHRGEFVKEIFPCDEKQDSLYSLLTNLREIRADKIIIATGKSEFRAPQVGSLKNRVGLDAGLVGFKMHLKLKPSAYARIQEHVDLFIFEKGYGGLSPIEDGKANLCFLIERQALANMGTDFDSLAGYIGRKNLSASRYLDGAEPLFKKPITVAKVPYGFLRNTRPEPGIFCVGDQMAVIPSLTGDGMTISLATAKAAAYSSQSAVYQRQMHSLLRRQVRTGFYLHRLFKHPILSDWAFALAPMIPNIVDGFFHRTRLGGPKRLPLNWLPETSTNLKEI